jgi:hypothetical protein
MNSIEEINKILAENDELMSKKKMKVIIGCTAANMGDIVYLLKQHAFPSRYIAFAMEDDPSGR